MISSCSRAWAQVDLSLVKHNVHEIQKIIPKTSKIMAIVKANSYGHGDIVMSKELEACGVDFFGVSSIDEAITLREGGIQSPILVLGYTPEEHFHYIWEQQIIQTIVSYDFAKKLNAAAKLAHQEVRVHIKVDTGMSRIGIRCTDEEYHIDDVKAVFELQQVHVEGIFSHFSVSDSLNNQEDLDFTKHQIELYERVLKDLRDAGCEYGKTHLQNSYGILNYPHLAYDYVRPGLLFLGITSDDALAIKTTPDFKPIMTLKANVSLVKQVEKGASISYGRHHRTQEVRRVATLSIGYADGIPRCISNKGGYVLLHEQKAPILGNVCMDQMIVDVTNINDVKEGDDAVIFGMDHDTCLSVDHLSRLSQTINNETFCRISERVPRIYKK